MKKIIFLFVSLFAFGSANAQTHADHQVTITVPAVSLIRILPATATTLTYTGAGITPGANMADQTSVINSVMLQYSSILASSGMSSKTIYVTSASSETQTNISGIRLSVFATQPTIDAAGVLSGGDPGQVNATPINLVGLTGLLVTSNSATNAIITGIKSCFTGTLSTNGASLNYRTTMSGVAPAQYATLRAKDYIITVTYTLADIA